MTEFDPQRGIDFPFADGVQSSMATGRAVFADAARATDPELAARTEATANWRKDYMAPVHDLVVSGLRAPGGTVRMSRDGLASLHDRFTFTRDGQPMGLTEAFATLTEPGFSTAEVVGRGRAVTELVVPYHGRQLSGADLRHQLDVWVAGDVVEPSFAEAIGLLISHPEWLDLTGEDFAVLGAGAEMGPLAQLLDWGATVWAVDLPRPEAWRRIIADAEVRAGRLRVPVPAGSIADIVAVTSRTTTADELNDIFREESETERYRGVLGVSDDPLVSSDVVGDGHGSLVDLTMTSVTDGDLVKVMAWYDNEWGYARQMVRGALSSVGDRADATAS